jgi:hemerythrin
MLMSPQGKSEVISPLAWRPELQLHVLDIDHQHEELLFRARVLEESIDPGKPLPELQVMLAALIDSTEMHFHTEEDLMRAQSYEGFPAHKAEHAELLDQAYLVRRELSTGEIHPCHMLSLFIQTWLNQHIVGLDKQFFASLASKHPPEGSLQ